MPLNRPLFQVHESECTFVDEQIRKSVQGVGGCVTCWTAALITGAPLTRLLDTWPTSALRVGGGGGDNGGGGGDEDGGGMSGGGGGD